MRMPWCFLPFPLAVFILVVGLRSRFSTMLKKEDIRKCSLKGKRNFHATSDMGGIKSFSPGNWAIAVRWCFNQAWWVRQSLLHSHLGQFRQFSVRQAHWRAQQHLLKGRSGKENGLRETSEEEEKGASRSQGGKRNKTLQWRYSAVKLTHWLVLKYLGVCTKSIFINFSIK